MPKKQKKKRSKKKVASAKRPAARRKSARDRSRALVVREAPEASLPTVRRVPSPTISMTDGQRRVIGEDPSLTRRHSELEKAVQFTVVTRTRSGEPLQQTRGTLHRSKLNEYRPDDHSRDRAVDYLERIGLEVVRRGRFGITVRGPAALVSEVVGEPLKLFSSPRVNTARSMRMLAAADEAPSAFDLYAAPEKSLSVRSKLMDAIDDFVFIPPPLYFAPAAAPPALNYHALDPEAIRNLLRVPDGVTGKDVRVAIVDTGFFQHPYFATNNLSLTPTSMPGGPPADVDDYGHGTAIALNLFAVAPEAAVFGIKQSDPPQDAIEFAAEQGAKIISCSWGWNYEQTFPVLEATIRSLIEDDGIIMLFAAGNGQYAWPGSMPDVLSIGGVYADDTNHLKASNYASGFNSSYYPGRRVPDVSGLVGQVPRGVYIPMPTQPGCEMDVSFAAASYPDGDDTGSNDGWVVASGTSSATPQIAGVVALLLERAASLNQPRQLDLASVRDILERSAQPVQEGRNAFGFPADGHPNVACGFGLVDAAAAVALL